MVEGLKVKVPVPPAAYVVTTFFTEVGEVFRPFRFEYKEALS